ncbi:MAG: metallopeptidase family protein, partial [Hyphomicrobiales bacterium]
MTPSLAALATLKAPSLEDFEAMADAAYAALPETFRQMAGSVIVRIEDFPTDDVLDDLEAETPFDLLGLFQGIGLTSAESMPATGQMPNLVFLYRRPILDYWAEHDEALGTIITHVLVHEIG